MKSSIRITNNGNTIRATGTAAQALFDAMNRNQQKSEEMATQGDRNLKVALAKILSDQIETDWELYSLNYAEPVFTWIKSANREVLETEWLHVCWLVEQELKANDFHGDYYKFCCEISEQDASQSASWQQRAMALCKVKGIAP